MTAPMDGFDEIDAVESFDDFEMADEAILARRPGKRVFVAGGLSTATLNTPKGPAKLSLPHAVPTLVQYRTLEAALNSNTQRMNAMQVELARLRRGIGARPASGGLDMMTLFTLMGQKKLREDLEGHTHEGVPPVVKLPAASSSTTGLSSMLPLLLLAPNMFGQSATPGSPAGGQDSMSPIMMMVLMDML